MEDSSIQIRCPQCKSGVERIYTKQIFDQTSLVTTIVWKKKQIIRCKTCGLVELVFSLNEKKIENPSAEIIFGYKSCPSCHNNLYPLYATSWETSGKIVLPDNQKFKDCFACRENAFYHRIINLINLAT